jgi:CxxC-x17-CxxC domain-containing protein
MATGIVLTCFDCGGSFSFSVGEQAFYSRRGLFQPRRCEACRVAKSAHRASSTRGLFRTTCTDCGRDAIVPFEPKLGRRVLCSTCFDPACASHEEGVIILSLS